MFEVAVLRPHCFEDRPNFPHFHSLKGVFFVFPQVHCCPHERIEECSPESLVDWEPVYK